jgi:TolA-binding protein
MATLLCPAHAPAEEFLLYAPKPAESAAVPSSPEEGILVRNVTIKGGDSLSKISREYSGHGSWYPQLLLFNKIKDPNLIYSGDTILVPISAERGVPDETKAAPRKAAKAAKPAKGHKAAKAGKGTKAGKGAKPAKAAKAAEPAAVKMAKPGKVPKPAKAGKVPEERRTEQTVVAPPIAPSAKLPKAERPAKPAKVESAKPAAAQVTMAGELDSFRQAKDAYLAGQYQKALDLFGEFIRRFPNSASTPEAELYRADSLLHLSGQ